LNLHPVAAVLEESTSVPGVTAYSAEPITSTKASFVRAWALRTSPLIFEKASSMGLKSGE
jgi:hypothetical protein